MSMFRRDPGESWGQFGRDRFRRLIPVFWANAFSAAGSVLVVTTVFLLLLMLVLYIYNAVLARQSNPYVDLVGFLILPALLAVGVVLLGVGQLIRRGRRRRGVPPTELEATGHVRIQRVIAAGLITFIVMIGLGVFSYEAYHYTDSNDFCTHVCHTVMEPEGTAYLSSPHARVGCVDCHIGEGADWYVRAKLSGIRQVWAVLTDSYHTPIPTPVENLRPARETCEECHWPARFHGARVVVRHGYEPDSANTRNTTALVVKVGGPGAGDDAARGIHWHVDPGNQIWYRHTDPERHQIVEVLRRTPEGDIRYLAPDAEPVELGTGPGDWRLMDCVDCHNRPTHRFEMPDGAVNAALEDGLLDPDLPWIKAASVAVLTDVVPGPDTVERIGAALVEFYAREHPEALPLVQEQLPQAAAVLAAILERNVFPAMDVTWGTYRSNIGHFTPDGDMSGGCFNCHDGEHVAESGETIEQDCDMCHAVLAWQEQDWQGLPGLTPELLRGR